MKRLVNVCLFLICLEKTGENGTMDMEKRLFLVYGHSEGFKACL